MTKDNADFGLIGLGVMGKSLLLNVADHGYQVVGYDKDNSKIDDVKNSGITAVQTLEDFVNSLTKPRKIMMLLPAGNIVDQVIADITPLFEAGDILMDGGNTFFKDTERRQAALATTGIHYLGIGVSGGEEGARNGPSMMPSGEQEAYQQLAPILTAIAAQYDGTPCVSHLGQGGAGHYVKMVHNGIEYALMQVLAEVYGVMKNALELSNTEISEVFETWNQGRLQSFLVDISIPILRQKAPQGDGDLVDVILDKGKQKGTGKWTSQNALDVGEPVPMIDAAVIARAVSGLKKQRVEAANSLRQNHVQEFIGGKQAILVQLEETTYFAFLLAYSQGMALLQTAKQEYGYSYDLAEVTSLWRGGCIIRARLLEDFRKAFGKDSDLANPMLDATIAEQLNSTEDSARKVVISALQGGIAVPCLSAGLAYFDSYRCSRLPTNFIQAQRDFFGAHTYERTDKDGIFHTQWGK